MKNPLMTTSVDAITSALSKTVSKLIVAEEHLSSEAKKYNDWSIQYANDAQESEAERDRAARIRAKLEELLS